MFGLSDGDGAIQALHNIFHTAYPDGRETCTIFVNTQVTQGRGVVKEGE
jgi:hypothetical protein